MKFLKNSFKWNDFRLTVFCLTIGWCWFFAVDGTNGAQVSGSDVTTVLNKLFSSSYDKRVRPDYGESPLKIRVSMYIIGAMDFSDKKTRLTTEFYFRQTWTDKRLAFSLQDLENVVGGEELDDKIWKPDTFIPGARTDLKTAYHVFVRISKDGTILRSVMVQSSTLCPMDFRYYPYDKQTCNIIFESYGFTAKDIQYEWAPKSPSQQSAAGFPDGLSVQGKQLMEIQLNTETISLTTGNYSRLQTDLVFRRTPGAYFFRAYFGPAIIFFLLAYSTFWWPSLGNVFGGFTIGSSFRGICLLTSMISNWLLLSRAGETVPLLDHVTRLDHYLVACFCFSVLAFFEYVAIILIQPLHPMEETQPTTSSLALQHLNSDTTELESNSKKISVEPEKLWSSSNRAVGEVSDNQGNHSTNNLANYLSRSAKYIISIRQHKGAQQKIDVCSRIIFGFIFVVYNLWFWLSFPI